MAHPGDDAGPETAEITGRGTYSVPGALLAQNLLAAGASAARTDARVGRSAYNFWNREHAADLIAADRAWRPDLVIVSLGTNDIGLNLTADHNAMQKIKDAFAPVEVFAIGPPSFPDGRDTQPVVDMMKLVFGADHFIDARIVTPVGAGVRTGDGVHFTTAGAKVYAEGLTRSVLSAGPMTLSKLGGSLIKIGAGLGLMAGLVGVAWLVGAKRRR